MDPVSLVIGLASNILNKLWGNKDDELKRQFILELQDKLNDTDLAKGQLEVNKQEAANPNRTWMTWRELAGYVCVAAMTWAYVLQPMLTYVVVISGYPAPQLPELDTTSLMMILGTMLGMGSMKSFEKVKGVKK
jgi:hypothetical protein